jgi:hypothetical protein
MKVQLYAKNTKGALYTKRCIASWDCSSNVAGLSPLLVSRVKTATTRLLSTEPGHCPVLLLSSKPAIKCYSTAIGGKRPGKKKSPTDRAKPYGFSAWPTHPSAGFLSVMANIYCTGLSIYPLANVTYKKKYNNPFMDYDRSLVPLTSEYGKPFFRDKTLSVEDSY